MEEIKEKLQQLEEQVSLIKDPALKKIAFEKLLEGSFGSAPHKPTRGGLKAIKKKASKKRGAVNLFYSEPQIDENVKKMTITGSIAGLPKFKYCKQKIDAYLWVLAYAKKHKIVALNNHEIAFIMSKRLDKPTKYSTVNGLRRKVKDGLVIKEPDTEKWKITSDGDVYLKTLEK